ncbi:MAG TPA: OsmC family protein [Acidimicrobiia bacterium]|nr:OsmC family protein [Acidimicrobiia bacterium]
MTQTDAPAVDNGVNIEALRGARQALTEAPEAAKFQWRASCEWVNGTHSRSTVSDFSGLGQNHAHRQAYSIEADHPQVFASEDNGATPPEIVLAALASCLTAGVATVATNRGVQLRSVTATVEGDMDLQGILGIDGDVRNGFETIRVTYDIDADAPRADLEAIVAQSQKRSAVFDIVTNPTTVRVALA